MPLNPETARNADGIILSNVTRLGLGTAQFGMRYGIANRTGQVGHDEGAAMLRYAGEAGIRLIDTAMAYGESEACLGQLGVSTIQVVTKLGKMPAGMSPALVRDFVLKSVAGSLARLQMPRLYALLLHHPEQLSGPLSASLVQALLELKEEGVVKKLGVSVYEPSEVDAAMCFPIVDLVQIPFNLVDRRLVSSGCLRKLRERGVEVHTRSTFLQGLLLMPPHAIPAAFRRWHALWERWHAWLAEHDITALRACLAYVLSHPAVDRVIVGADGLAQLREIATAADAPCPEYPEIASDDLNLINPSLWIR